MRILIATDVFPPGCGGSGWSTYELARGLRARGHAITLVRPDPAARRAGAGATAAGAGGQAADAGAALGDAAAGAAPGYDGFAPIPFPAWAPPVPYLRNYVRNERLFRRLARFLETLIRARGIEVVHAQHRLTGPPGVAAARRAGVGVVCTVRDYWPVCYWSDLLPDPAGDGRCPACTPGMMTRCIRPRAGLAWPLATPFIPYMRANLRRKRAALAGAGAVIAVGSAIARDLVTLAPELSAGAVATIPNPVDVPALQAEAARQPAPSDGPYVLFAGKLEPNKGVSHLVPALEAAQIDLPLVVVGDGAERSRLAAAAQAAGRDVRIVGWRPRAETLGWMRHADAVLFPSRWPEPLSRVLLEAAALGRPIAAMETGGTGDIVIHGETGLLSWTAAGLGRDLARLRGDAALRARLGAAARRHVERTFDARVVVPRIEAVYAAVRRAAAAGAPATPAAAP